MLNYREFIQSTHSFAINEHKSAFDDIFYRDNLGRTMFNTADDFTIDFVHMTDAYFTGNDEALNKYLVKFNQFYKSDISLEQLKNIMPELEEHWTDDSDLTLNQIIFFVNNPDKISDYFKSKNMINKYNL